VTRVAAVALLAALATGGAGAPVATSRPAVTGTLREGSRLTANPGSWSTIGAITFAYQWYRCGAAGGHCNSIHGATRGSYTQVHADVGHALGVTVRAQGAGGPAVAYAPLAGLVAPASAPFAAAAQPTLSGEAIVGRSLSVDAVRWTASAPSATFRWLRCNANGRLCSTIDGARGVGYAVTAADVGHVLVALVTAARQTVLSVASGVVRAASGPVALARPSLRGSLQVGARLNGDAGVWSGGGTIGYAYQWYRCDARGAHCTTLRGATRNAYVQVAADAGHTLALTVHATDSTGTAAAYSSLAGVVASSGVAVVARSQPSLEGIPAPGQELQVTGASFTAKPSSTSYSWLRCTPAVRTCVPIAGADQAVYTVAPDDAGHALVASLTTVAAGRRLVTLSTAATVGQSS
jgi:hypothetical protein